jgi:hypothetical protein
MKALVYTGVEELIYREENKPQEIPGESIIKVKVIDLNNIFCDKIKCLVGNKKSSYYYDKSHLSKKGAKMAKNLLLKYLD